MIDPKKNIITDKYRKIRKLNIFETMKLIYLLLILTPFGGHSQFEIGSTSIVFTDVGRSREIETFIYYPADTAGADVVLAEGLFPVISVGHGFLMTYESYQYIWEHYVPLGYIVILPNTESALPVSHHDFGKDLSYVIHAIQDENEIESSLFFGHVSPHSAVVGHSMGGGASILASAEDASIATVVTFAAAETDPSAIAAAGSINQPSLTFAGENDCVAPPVDHQEPMYSNHNDCKGYVLITGGSHCQFANSNFVCELGEFGCPGGGISESEQHAAVLEILTPWLQAYLKTDYTAWEEVVALEGTGDNYYFTLDCSDHAPVLSVNSSVNSVEFVYPNPSNGLVTIPLNYQAKNYRILASDGRIVQNGITTSQLDFTSLKNGLYLLQIEIGNGEVLTKRLVMEV